MLENKAWVKYDVTILPFFFLIKLYGIERIKGIKVLYLEELTEAIISEEGQTLMGLDFLFSTLDFPMSKVDLIFKKALLEYSERRPMKKTTVVNNFDYVSGDGESGYIKMPEGTTSCRVARYGVLPNQMPRYYMPKFGEQNVEFDPVTGTCKVWPPVTPLRLTYTQRYVPTTSVLIEKMIDLPYETDEVEYILDTAYAAKTLSIQKSVSFEDENGKLTSEILSMSPTGYVNERLEDGETISEAILKGTLGTGTVNLKTREINLQVVDSSIAPIVISYYPKYSVVKEMDLGDRLFNKFFASRLLGALASLRAQATQSKLHNIDLTTDDLLNRVAELKREIKEELKSALSFGDLAPM